MFANAFIGYALLLQLVASILGAKILANTVGYIKATLKLNSLEYGWIQRFALTYSRVPQEGSQGEAPQWVLYSYLWQV